MNNKIIVLGAYRVSKNTGLDYDKALLEFYKKQWSDYTFNHQFIEKEVSPYER
jgi:hypothetical protein